MSSSLNGAKACFSENTARAHKLEDENLKAIAWNLNTGLLRLTDFLEEELRAIRAEIQNR